MKNLKIILLFYVIASLFTNCTLNENFTNPIYLENGGAIDKKKQYLIDNSPFYLVRSSRGSTYNSDTGVSTPAKLAYTAFLDDEVVDDLDVNPLTYNPTDDINVDNYIFSISFFDNNIFRTNECIGNTQTEEYGKWSLRFYDSDFVIAKFEPESSAYLSTILEFDNNEPTSVFMQEAFRHKREWEQSKNFLKPFFIGGAINTLEIMGTYGVLEKNTAGEYDFISSSQHIYSRYQLNDDTLYLNYINQYGYRLFRGDFSTYPNRITYVDEWGYLRRAYSNYNENRFSKIFASINNPIFNYEEVSFATDFTCINTTDPCDELNCVNGIEQTNDNGDCFCECEPGWTGPNCDQPVTTLPVNMQLLAGDGTQGNANGTFGQLNFPQAVATSSDGTAVYIADGSRSIRMVNPISNEITTLLGGNVAGYVDGAYADARFNSFGDIALDDAGNIYISDAGNNVIRKIANGQVTTYAGTGLPGLNNGLASAAQFRYPLGLLISNNIMYVADNENHCIRAITMSDDPSQRTVSTFAGTGAVGTNDGLNSQATFSGPRDLTYDVVNDRLLVSDYGFLSGAMPNIRAIASGTTTLITDLPGSQTLQEPGGIAIDEVANDDSFYLSDRANHTLYHLSDVGGTYATSLVTAGQHQTTGNVGGAPGDSRLNTPNLLHIGKSLNSNNQLETRLYIVNTLGHSVWYIPIRVE